MTLQERQRALIDKTERVWNEAKRMYRLADCPVTVKFELKGKAAAAAYPSKKGVFTISYNLEAVKVGFEELMESTVAHEVAHLVCFANPFYGNNHDKGWKRVCISLGGNGKRCHSLKLSPGRGLSQYKYRMACGREVMLTTIRHNRLQYGGYWYTVGGKPLLPEHFVGKEMKA